MWEKNENKQKEAGFGPFFKKEAKVIFNSLDRGRDLVAKAVVSNTWGQRFESSHCIF